MLWSPVEQLINPRVGAPFGEMMDVVSSGANTVEFHLYFVNEERSAEQLVEEIEQFAVRFFGSWFFHCDYIRFQIGSKLSGELTHIFGALRYGLNVNDEWMVLKLLLELSKVHPNTVAQCQDWDDGEFLLVETAEVLPDFLESEVQGSGRVFIKDGKVHFAPLEVNIRENVRAAVEAISHAGCSTEMDWKVQKCIQERIASLPRVNSHSLAVVLPKVAAQVLSSDPGLISFAVNALEQHDPMDLRDIQGMQIFGSGPVTDCAVKTTQVQQGEIRSAKGIRIPDILRSLLGTSASSTETELGSLMAVGLELAYHSAKKVLSDHDSNAATAAYKERFLKSLEAQGYFGTERRGSQKWTEMATTVLANWEEEIRSGRVPLIQSSDGPLYAAECLRRMDAGLEKAKAGHVHIVEPDSIPSSLRVQDDSESPSDVNLQMETEMALQGLETFMNDISGLEGVEAERPLEVDPAAVVAAAMEALGVDDAEIAGITGISPAAEQDGSDSDDLGHVGELQIDRDMAENILKSIQGQHGAAGPATNLLGSLGFSVDKISALAADLEDTDNS